MEAITVVQRQSSRRYRVRHCFWNPASTRWGGYDVATTVLSEHIEYKEMGNAKKKKT